jgi:hypothetical protein
MGMIHLIVFIAAAIWWVIKGSGSMQKHLRHPEASLSRRRDYQGAARRHEKGLEGVRRYADYGWAEQAVRTGIR